MRYEIAPGKERRSMNVVDDLCFSRVKDLDGNDLELRMSLILQNGNSEMRLADGVDDEVSTGRQPVIVWFNGAGWRKCDRNLMAAEMVFLAERGFAVAFIEYRHSGLGKFPAQLIDCKTAVRFLRAHAEQFWLDPRYVGVIGRSAGGHLAAFMAMNTAGYDSEEWSGFSSEVQAAVDLFGPVDIQRLNRITEQKLKTPGYRWKRMEESHEGMLLGGDMTTIWERSWAASPVNFINDGMCPLCILHGDQDPLVPLQISESFYQRIVEAGLEERADLYVLKNGGHGTREFFQPETKRIIGDFFEKNLKQEKTNSGSDG